MNKPVLFKRPENWEQMTQAEQEAYARAIAEQLISAPRPTRARATVRGLAPSAKRWVRPQILETGSRLPADSRF